MAKLNSKNRILETVTGYENAIKDITSRIACWNDCNGEGRMAFGPYNKLEAHDQEGSGEFFIAVCLNLNEAEDCAHEIYEIQTCW